MRNNRTGIAVNEASKLKKTADTNCAMHCEATACAGQWLYLLGNEGVVYSEIQNRFAGLGAAGVSAYRAFDAGASIQDLRSSSEARSSSFDWRDELETIYALSKGAFPADDGQEGWPTFNHSLTANIEIHGIPVLLEYPAGPFEGLCLDYFRNCPVTTQLARCHLSAQHTENGWSIYGNGSELLASLRDQQVGLGLLHAARSLLYAEAKYDVAFHAAMVAHDDRGVLLCAPREGGKSTLAAYLVTQGFELLTDEPALLDLDSCAVSPLDLPLSLKEGSWDVLRHEWPQMADTPVHVRSDGVKIRLLHPPRARLSLPRRLTHIAFPEYRASSEAYSERLSPLRTVKLLDEGGMILARHLTRDTFEAFLRLVCTTPAYVVRYASLQEAGRMICELPVGIESPANEA